MTPCWNCILPSAPIRSNLVLEGTCIDFMACYLVARAAVCRPRRILLATVSRSRQSTVG